MLLLSDIFGNFSQLFWISAQLPQIWKNYQNKSIEGLSLPFLLNWLCGDFTNLIGCLFTNQLSFQRNLAIYFNFIDLILIGQFIMYSKPPLSSGLEPDSTQINPGVFFTEPATVLHSGPNVESDDILTHGLDLLSDRSAPCIDQSISDETSKTSCSRLHSRIHLSHPSTPLNPAYDPSESLGPSTHSSSPTPRTHSRLVQVIKSYSLKIIMFLAILVFLTFGASISKNLFSLIYANCPSDLQTQLFSSQTSPNNDGLNLSMNYSNGPHNLILHSPDSISSSFLQKTNGARSLPSNKSIDTSEKEKPGSITRHIGKISAWLCAFLYLTSRIPQIFKNYSRKSVEGLSILLFVLAFLGNLTYVASILTSPKVLGRNEREENKSSYLNESIPYLIGSAGTLCFDFTIFIQSWIYRKLPMPLLEHSYRKLSTASDSSGSSSCSNSIINL